MSTLIKEVMKVDLCASLDAIFAEKLPNVPNMLRQKGIDRFYMPVGLC